MVKVRAEKTTRNADDYKVLMVGIFAAILIMTTSMVLPRFGEQRWYRDLTRLTPFHDARLLYSRVGNDKIQVLFGGTLVKRRCEFNNLFGYIYGSNGIKYRVPVDTSAEPGSGNRPPSYGGTPESWGPWVLRMTDNPNIPPTVVPLSFEIIAEHVNCPTDPETQRNLFVKGDWADFSYVPEEVIEMMEKETN